MPSLLLLNYLISHFPSHLYGWLHNLKFPSILLNKALLIQYLVLWKGNKHQSNEFQLFQIHVLLVLLKSPSNPPYKFRLLVPHLLLRFDLLSKFKHLPFNEMLDNVLSQLHLISKHPQKLKMNCSHSPSFQFGVH